MGLIEVIGIKVFAYHGCLEEESTIGGQYVVDVRVEGDFGEAERKDDLAATVDYGAVAAIVRAEMSTRSRLIEHVTARILARLRSTWGPEHRWRVRVVKLRPPIQGDVEQAVYTVEG